MEPVVFLAAIFDRTGAKSREDTLKQHRKAIIVGASDTNCWHSICAFGGRTGSKIQEPEVLAKVSR